MELLTNCTSHLFDHQLMTMIHGSNSPSLLLLPRGRQGAHTLGLTRQTLAGIKPNLTVVKFQTFDQQIADRFTGDRMIARLTMLLGALALLLATVGLYGVTAYTVARRTSEIGIRMALGAERVGVIAMVMRGAMFQTALGLLVGIPAALLCMRCVEALLYEVNGMDPRVLGMSILTLATTASAAGLMPARRAASTDPARALRTE
jgi:macrolide transport system ATP-binding/permease protein